MPVIKCNTYPVEIPDGHDDRLVGPARPNALQATGLMDGPPKEAFDRVVRLTMQLVGASAGLLVLVDDRRLVLKACAGVPAGYADLHRAPLHSSFCQYVVTQDRALAVPDARLHPLLSGNAAVSGQGVIACLGVPVRAPDDQPIGSLCVIDNQPRDWTDTQLVAMQDMAAIIETELTLRRNIADRAVIAAELDHRLKNLFTLVAGMIRLARREHETVETYAGDIENRVTALARAHELISPALVAGSPCGAQVDLAYLVNTLLAPYRDTGQDRIGIGGQTVLLGAKATTSLLLALHELATNAAKYGALGDENGRLTISWQVQDSVLHLDWREQTGARIELNVGEGFGSQLLQVSVKDQLTGTISHRSLPDGLTLRLSVPLCALSR